MMGPPARPRLPERYAWLTGKQLRDAQLDDPTVFVKYEEDMEHWADEMERYVGDLDAFYQKVLSSIVAALKSTRTARHRVL